MDFLEYCAALAPWATFNTNRPKDAEMMPPMDFMLRRRARVALTEAPEASEPSAGPPATLHRGRPAVLLAPVPVTGMRYAVKGERPPSKYSPGENDGVIDRYDAYARSYWSGAVRHHGR